MFVCARALCVTCFVREKNKYEVCSFLGLWICRGYRENRVDSEIFGIFFVVAVLWLPEGCVAKIASSGEGKTEQDWRMETHLFAKALKKFNNIVQRSGEKEEEPGTSMSSTARMPAGPNSIVCAHLIMAKHLYSFSFDVNNAFTLSALRLHTWRRREYENIT